MGGVNPNCLNLLKGNKMFGANYTDGGILNYRSAGEINSAMGRVYGHMSLAVVVSMLVSYFVGTSPELLQFFFTGVMKWIVIFAPLVAIFGVAMVLGNEPSKGVAQLCLHGFAALMGLSFATIFALFTMGSIVSAFMGAAILFGVMSFYGYFTKRSLESLGQFMFIGLIAICIASIVNIFIGSTVMQMVISALAIIIFLGLTAYDTQQIREELSMDTTPAAEVRGALTLYMDFINLFINLLQLFGDRK
jgi:FtsH-binding integral membrane protein